MSYYRILNHQITIKLFLKRKNTCLFHKLTNTQCINQFNTKSFKISDRELLYPYSTALSTNQWSVFPVVNHNSLKPKSYNPTRIHMMKKIPRFRHQTWARIKSKEKNKGAPLHLWRNHRLAIRRFFQDLSTSILFYRVRRSRNCK